MFKEDQLVGAITIYRREVRPFSDKQIELVESFAAQAVIAIENMRLLNELRQSLEQQTATADVLRVISSSPGDLQPVFHTMLENATRICEAKFGVLSLKEDDVFRVVAIHNAPPAFTELRKREPTFRPSGRMGELMAEAIATKRAVQLTDFAEYTDDPLDRAFSAATQARSIILVPMLKENKIVGTSAIFRQEVRPFNDKQVELLTNFANQAVIAIENTRLLTELRQSLQQQTATADVRHANRARHAGRLRCAALRSGRGGHEPTRRICLPRRLGLRPVIRAARGDSTSSDPGWARHDYRASGTGTRRHPRPGY
jgi:GAF domain-containing protein